MAGNEHGGDRKSWWKEPRYEAHDAIVRQLADVERRQSKTFEKFARLEILYDPNSSRADLVGRGGVDSLRLVTENVIASNVDTVTAAIAATDVRARFMTDDADWSEQRKARHLEWYAESLSTLLDVDAKCRLAFKGAALKGSGFVFVTAAANDEIRVEQVPVDEVIVDESEAHDAGTRELHRRHTVDREWLKSQYPKKADKIEDAQSGANRTWRLWTGVLSSNSNEVVRICSWRLPIGTKGKKGYVPGRYVEIIDGCTLVDRKWEKPFFPAARFVWCEAPRGYYGISGAERVAGHQRAIDKMNWQIDRQLDQWAVPTQFVRPVDANLTVKTVNRAGAIAVVKGEYPKTVIPQAVSGEVYARLDRMKSSAFEEFGMSRMAAQSMKPAGLDSGVALREYRDQTTQRFALQEKGYEQLKLDVIVLILDVCKDLGAAAPEVMRRTKFGARKIPWSKVDMGDVKVQIAAASTLARTPAGRMQTVLEWAQAGIISKDEATRLMQHPDLERAMSLYTAALENVEHCLEEIRDGAIVMPEPFMNLEMIVWRGQMTYLEDRDSSAPEEILESMRQFVVQAAWMLSQRNAANTNAAPGQDPAQGGQMPNLPGQPPAAVTPQAALSPQAMQLRAS